jgi:hypothetical protein
MQSRKISFDDMLPTNNLKVESKPPDYGRDKLKNYIESFSRRKTEEYQKFLKSFNRSRNREQRAFFDRMFDIESYLPKSTFHELSKQDIKDMIYHLKDSAHREIEDYMEFTSELFHKEILEHKNYIEWFIDKEFERFNHLIKEIYYQKKQLSSFNLERFFNELVRYFGTPERLKPLPKIKRLSSFGLPDEIALFLLNLINDSNTEEDVVSTFLYALSKKYLAAHLSRQLKRIIDKSYKMSSQNQDLYKKIFHKIERLQEIVRTI